MQAILVPSKEKGFPYFRGFRYISNRHENEYSCHWALWRRVPELSIATLVRKASTVCTSGIMSSCWINQWYRTMLCERHASIQTIRWIVYSSGL